MILTFNNCGGFEALKEAKNFGSDCLTKVSTAQVNADNTNADSAVRSLASNTSINCNDFLLIQCEVRTYSPFILNSNTEEKLCLTSDKCVTVSIYSYNTQKVYESGDFAPGSFDEGGEYNRSDAKCGYIVNSNSMHYSYAGENAELKTALELSVQNCKEAQP